MWTCSMFLHWSLPKTVSEHCGGSLCVHPCVSEQQAGICSFVRLLWGCLASSWVFFVTGWRPLNGSLVPYLIGKLRCWSKGTRRAPSGESMWQVKVGIWKKCGAGEGGRREWLSALVFVPHCLIVNSPLAARLKRCPFKYSSILCAHWDLT